MAKAVLTIEAGKGAKRYMAVIGNERGHRRSKVRMAERSGTITIEVDAEDVRALLGSLNGALKQLRVVSSVDAALGEG